MKYFVLEDDPERVKWFEDQFNAKGYQYEITEYVDIAIDRLTTEKFDMIFLDHDLGGEQMVDSDNSNTGYQVAKHIPSTINKDTRIIIHSYNPVGANNIFEVLRENECKYVLKVPFGNFTI